MQNPQMLRSVLTYLILFPQLIFHFHRTIHCNYLKEHFFMNLSCLCSIYPLLKTALFVNLLTSKINQTNGGTNMIMRLSKKSRYTIVAAGFFAAFLFILNTARAGDRPEVSYTDGLLSVKAVKVPLLPVLESIGKAAGIEIFVSRDLKSGNISIQVIDKPLEDVLKRLLAFFNHVVVYEKKRKNVHISALKVYPPGKNAGSLVALKTQGRSGRNEVTAKLGKRGKESEQAFFQTTSFHGGKRSVKSGLLIPNRYEAANKEGFAASMSKRLEIQEQGAYKEINVLKAQISCTKNKEKENGLTFVLLDKIEKLEKLQRLNRNKMEAFHRIELFNENKKSLIK